MNMDGRARETVYSFLFVLFVRSSPFTSHPNACLRPKIDRQRQPHPKPLTGWANSCTGNQASYSTWAGCRVGRGFRFLKDPLFFASRFFLKKPSRIMALLMIMGLSLLIYALAEHELREQLKAQEQFIPDQKGKPTQRPTMRRVFQMFEGIHILLAETSELRKRMVLNVQDVHRQIATLLGETVLQFYLLND
jgi:hypothetical protein